MQDDEELPSLAWRVGKLVLLLVLTMFMIIGCTFGAVTIGVLVYASTTSIAKGLAVGIACSVALSGGSFTQLNRLQDWLVPDFGKRYDK